MFFARAYIVKKKRLIFNRHQKKENLASIFLLPILNNALEISDTHKENQQVLPVNTKTKSENYSSTKHFNATSIALTDANLSIKKIGAEFLQQENRQEISSNVVVSQAEIQDKYQDFLHQLSEEDHLKPILKSAKYDIQKQCISLHFYSLSEMRLVEKSKDKIVHFLRTQLHNSNITLNIQQHVEQDQTLKTSSFDLWRKILEENTEVKKFIEIFALQNN